jgi:hypothetical protein
MLSRRLSTGIWPGTDVLRECLNGRVTAAPLSVVVRTDILRRNHLFSSGYKCAADLGWFSALIEGRAGLINERCADYLVHDAAISARIPAEDRIREYSRAMADLSSAMERKIADGAMRTDLQRQIWRYLALQIMITLVLYRRAGASFADVVRKLRHWCPILKRCTLKDFAAVLRIRSVARILLPPTLTRWSLALRLDKLA